MSGTVENLIQGTGFLYVGALDAEEPTDDALHTPPDDSVWTSLGFTQDGITLNFEQEFSELAVDQVVDVPGRRLVGRDLMFGTNLAEPTLKNLKFALNGGTLSEETTAGEDTSGIQSYQPENNPTGEPNYAKLLFDGLGPNGRPRRVLVRKALQVGNVGSSYQKDGQTLFPVELRAHYVSSSIAPYKVVDQVASPTGS